MRLASLAQCGEKFLFKGGQYAHRMHDQESTWQGKKDAEAQQKLEKKQMEKARQSGIGLALPGSKKNKTSMGGGGGGGKRSLLKDVN